MLLYIVGWFVVILMVAFGLGFVIFVHELGHFLVAKACGVKCEKFYLGFDIGGLRLCRFRWGETEYGIGIFPLGGYVKMLGQEDNPAKLREEIERAKAAEASGEVAVPSPETAALYDPRSFLAQSVPKRMAIISAGVIMNLIFAFLMAVAAFYAGVDQTPCVVGPVFPGKPAWDADIRPGDHILKIAGKEMTQFRDLQTAISLGDIDEKTGVPIEIQRPGVKEPFTVTVKPDNSLGVFFIGVGNGLTTQLNTSRATWLVQKRKAVARGSAAARAEPAFCNGDRIVQIDNVPVKDYGEINAELARKADKKISVMISRDEDADTKKLISVPVSPTPMRTLGLVMKMGPVTAVQANSPAAAAAIQVGDTIVKIDDKPVADPMMLPDLLARRAGETVRLTLQRKDAKEPVEVSVKLRKPISFCESGLEDSPVEVSALGLTYRVLNEVERVNEGSPAAKAGFLPGDVVTQAKLTPPKDIEKKAGEESGAVQKETTLKFNDKDKRNWPLFSSALQVYLPGTEVELKVLRGNDEKALTLAAVDATDWFNPERGFLFEPLVTLHRAESVGEAFSKGGQETLAALTVVFRSLKKLGTAQVSSRNLVGPVGIFGMAVNSADQGHAKLLLFLTMLSANLAILNILPIPLLDGGLLMFMCYEAIRGKPANEHVQVVLTYTGLALILTLMVWVLGLDFGLISRH